MIETILGLIFVITAVALMNIIDDKMAGRHYKSDAEKTDEDRRKDREREDEMHRITWE